jgi:hypothetical protein
MRQDMAYVRLVLDEGLRALERAVEGMSQEQLTFRPAGGWSALDVLEHVAITEPVLLEMLSRARPEEGRAPSDPAKDALTVERIAGRGKRVQAPAGLEPAGRFASARKALAELRRQRERTLAFVDACNSDLRNLYSDHPILGVIPAYTCLLLLAAHPMRHANQIVELRAETGL